MSLFKRITRDEMYACYKTSKHQPRCHISITIHHKFLQFAGGEFRTWELNYLGILLSPFSMSSSSESSLYSTINRKLFEAKRSLPSSIVMKGEVITEWIFIISTNYRQQFSLLFDHKSLIGLSLSKSTMGRLVGNAIT